MNSLPDPSFYLQLSESFIKTARLNVSEEKPELSALREISSAELASQPNPIIQVAGEGHELPIPVATTLSLGETIFQSHAFNQIGFSTLTEFISQGGSGHLNLFELGVFQKVNGLPAPTASPTPLELVFCGFNTKAIPELSDAFPNLDVTPTSITLSAMDQFRFLKSQCSEDDQVLLVEIGNDRTHLFLINKDGLSGIQIVDLGRHSLYESMAEVLHLHYIGSAIKLFTRSGFDSSDLAPRLGSLFGSAISSALEAAGWNPNSVHITGLLRAQSWFSDAILEALNTKAFAVDASLLPFSIAESLGAISAMDTEILAKIYTSLTSDEDFSWHNDYLGCLNKSATIPRREPSGSNPPFPTAHPDRASEPVTNIEVPSQPPTESIPVADPSPYAPPPLSNPESTTVPVEPSPPPESPPAPPPQTVVPSGPGPQATKEVRSIPAHLLNEIEEYEGEFEEVDDFGGGTANLVIKLGLMLLSLAIIGVIVTIVFFPKASEKYLGIRPPHINFDDSDPNLSGGPLSANQGGGVSPIEVTEADIASELQDLQSARGNQAFGGLYMLTNPSGATVIVGDMQPQLSPIKMPNIAPGDYEITISKDGYESQTLTVTIQPKQVYKTDTINLKRVR